MRTASVYVSASNDSSGTVTWPVVVVGCGSLNTSAPSTRDIRPPLAFTNARGSMIATIHAVAFIGLGLAELDKSVKRTRAVS